jgi:phosphoserine phosphatase
MKPLYIFDLDGTLALIQHRRHFVERERGKQDWKGFYAACVDDEPHSPVLRVMESLRQTGAEIWIFSGRSDEVRKQTMAWLAAHTSFMVQDLVGPILTMRAAGDYTPDDALKRGWLEGMLPEDRNRPQCAFDDRDRVVKMWRAAGVTCLQVAEGEF